MDTTHYPWYSTWWGKTLIAVLFLFFTITVAAVLYIRDIVKDIRSQSQYAKQIKNLKESEIYNISTTTSHKIGAANPELTLIVFSDFACPYCKSSYPAIREISRIHNDKVLIIFKDYPLHEESAILSMAARCAGEQGFFWPMHDKLFQNQGATTFDEMVFLANQVGVDLERFAECLNQNKYLKNIQNDFLEAENLGLEGTPTFFINGRKIEGEIPYATLIKLIESLL